MQQPGGPPPSCRPQAAAARQAHQRLGQCAYCQQALAVDKSSKHTNQSPAADLGQRPGLQIAAGTARSCCGARAAGRAAACGPAQARHRSDAKHTHSTGAVLVSLNRQAALCCAAALSRASCRRRRVRAPPRARAPALPPPAARGTAGRRAARGPPSAPGTPATALRASSPLLSRSARWQCAHRAQQQEGRRRAGKACIQARL